MHSARAYRLDVDHWSWYAPSFPESFDDQSRRRSQRAVVHRIFSNTAAAMSAVAACSIESEHAVSRIHYPMTEPVFYAALFWSALFHGSIPPDSRRWGSLIGAGLAAFAASLTAIGSTRSSFFRSRRFTFWICADGRRKLRTMGLRPRLLCNIRSSTGALAGAQSLVTSGIRSISLSWTLFWRWRSRGKRPIRAAKTGAWRFSIFSRRGKPIAGLAKLLLLGSSGIGDTLFRGVIWLRRFF